MIFSRPRAQHLNFSLLFVYLILPSTSTVIFDTFICRTFDSGRFLEAQMTLTCDETNYNRRWWMIYAFVCIAIYPVCVPAFCMMMLWKHREEINPPNVKSIKQALQKRRNLPQLGMIKFLFQMFTPRCYWFGIFLLWFVKAPESPLSHAFSIISRRRARSLSCPSPGLVFETSVLVFMPLQMQLVFASCVALIYVAVLRESSPFLTAEDNLIALLAAGQSSHGESAVLSRAPHPYDMTRTRALFSGFADDDQIQEYRADAREIRRLRSGCHRARSRHLAHAIRARAPSWRSCARGSA